MQNDKLLKISVAQNRKSLKWVTEEIRWSDFIKKISTPIRTTETFEQFMKMKKSQQDELKDVGGFVAGELKDNRRKAENVINRCLVTLDADNIQTEQTKKIINLVDGIGCGYAIYSTRKHCSYKPRLRIIIPLDRAVSCEEYEPIARKIASCIGIDIMDPSTFEPSRLMYWPSCSRNSEFEFRFKDKPFVNASGVLALYDNWKDSTEWPKIQNEPEQIKREITKQKDPLEKEGIVGAFCRVYDISTAIEKFLPNVYEQGNGPDKYTYINGSVANGATVYGDGKWLYSFHATDPASRTLCNSFDLVRIHKFRGLDNDANENTPANKLPSYLAMNKFALEDIKVAEIFERQKLEKAKSEFGIAFDNSASEITEDDIQWRLEKLKRNTNGVIERSINNAVVILENDTAFKNKLVYDRFSNRFLIKEAMPWNRKDDNNFPRLWNNSDDSELRCYFENIYEGFKNIGAISDALSILSNRNSINVVKDYFESLVWDGQNRLDTLLIDYLGADDNEYVRDITRKSLTAVVYRAITEKPIKFDNMVILTGPQGIGKSTLLSKLAGDWFTDNIVDFNSKDTLLLLQNCIIVEVPELQGFNKADSNRLKQFLGQKTDKYRAPYERREEEHPRHCVFFGTTNDDEFLRDTTGNRRYWPVQVGINKPTKSVFKDFENERNQIWAEAVCKFRIGESLYIEGNVLKMAEDEQASRLITDPWESVIFEYLERKIPEDWFDRSIEEQKNYWAFNSENKNTENLVERDRVCTNEILTICLEIEPRRQTSIDRNRVVGILRKMSDYCFKKTIRFGSSYRTN